MAETEEVEQLRRRARRRLVGAAAIVLFLVVVPPLLMDLEPKPVNSNLSVEIPSPSAVRVDRKPESDAPLPAPSSSGGTSSAGSANQSNPPATAPGVAPSAPPSGLPERGAAGGPQPSGKQGAAELPTSRAGIKLSEGAARSGSQVSTGAEASSKNGPDAKTGAQSSAGSGAGAPGPEAAPAKSGIDAAPKGGPDTPTSEAQASDASREAYFVPLGTFAERHNAQQLMHKAVQLGVRVYAEQIPGASGHRTRVRAGPFTSREAAEKARSVLRKSGIEASAVQRNEQRG